MIILFKKSCIPILIILLASCSSVPERTPVPRDKILKAEIPGVPNARFWGDQWPKYSLDKFNNYTEEEYQKYFSSVYKTEHSYLAISGGGADGAYGAGLLRGWSELGTRPRFAMVTGISTGALSAPFAFLGEKYDWILEEVYTTLTTKDIINEKGVFEAAFGDSLVDTAPLAKLLKKYLTDEMIGEIALEYKKGRRLFIGTVSLDAGRSVIWDIGAIASSNYDYKNQLVRDVMLASASIPVAFPPIAVEVEAEGNFYKELHVDGGTGSQVFVYPADIDWRKVTQKLQVKGTPQVYVIRNAYLKPDYEGVNRSVLSIAKRSIATLIRTQGIGDLFQIHSLCKRDGNAYNLTYIPETFLEEPTELFDEVYMKKLYEMGRTRIKAGSAWQDSPPGYSDVH